MEAISTWLLANGYQVVEGDGPRYVIGDKGKRPLTDEEEMMLVKAKTDWRNRFA